MSRPLDDFLHVAFAPLAEGEQVFLSNAYIKRDGESAFPPVRWVRGERYRPLGLHYNCCAFKADASRAKHENATRTFVIMLDDVGDMPGKSKAPLDRVMALPIPPHAVVATRRDAEGRINCQACWFIVPVSTDAARALVRAAARAGWGDPNAVSPVQWARPPGSLKLDGNGFPAELVMSNLDAPRAAIDTLARALGVPDYMTDAPSSRSDRGPPGDPPDAALARAAMAAIANDLNRDEWVCLGLALKACCGPPPALSDAEGYVLFDEFSSRHASYDARHTRGCWRSFRPSGAVGFGTIVWLARRCGWNLRRAEQALQGEAARREAASHAACLADIDGFVRLLESQFKSQPETQSGLASSDNGVPHAAVHRAR